MTPSVETTIWLAIKSRVDMLSIDKLWPAERSVPTREHVSVGRVVATPIRHLIPDGRPHERTGFLMLTHGMPIAQIQNVAQPIEKAGQIAAHFPDGTKMQMNSICVIVTDYPHVAEGYEEDGWWFTPVRVPWRCFA